MLQPVTTLPPVKTNGRPREAETPASHFSEGHWSCPRRIS